MHYAQIELKLTCADTTGFINILSNSDIVLNHVRYGNALEVFISIPGKYYKKIVALSKRHGVSVTIIRKTGLLFYIQRIVNRPVIAVLFLILLFINIILPNFVLFLSVEGNHTIPSKKILETAAECGIGFGSLRKSIRSETMKNSLLEKIPQLQWAGINTSGCTAIISIREKNQNENTANTHNVGNVVASHDGIIQNITIFEGNSLCYVGQAVMKGQTLVSGYTDCGIITKASQANAEIIALTSRNLDIIAPAPAFKKGDSLSTETTYSLQVGKKIINFSKESGILGATCDKIYLKKYWHLPGGFQLPVCLIQETTTWYRPQPYSLQTTQDSRWLLDFAHSYLKSTMIAGEILSSNTETDLLNDATYLNGQFTCTEIIGQIKHEQMIIKDEEND